MEAHEDRRQAAIERIEAKRRFWTHAVVYVAVNAFLLILWTLQGAEGEPWPLWTIAGWGLGLALHAWNVYIRRPVTEDQIAREITRSS